MNSTIAGFLIFKSPNKYTKPSSTSPNLHILSISVSANALQVTQEEAFAIGSCCGTAQFHQDRVNEYIEFKSGKKSLMDLVFKNNIMLTLHEYKCNWRYYNNQQLKRWFGKDLIDIY
jgi:hypothetical protein